MKSIHTIYSAIRSPMYIPTKHVICTQIDPLNTGKNYVSMHKQIWVDFIEQQTHLLWVTPFPSCSRWLPFRKQFLIRQHFCKSEHNHKVTQHIVTTYIHVLQLMLVNNMNVMRSIGVAFCGTLFLACIFFLVRRLYCNFFRNDVISVLQWLPREHSEH